MTTTVQHSAYSQVSQQSGVTRVTHSETEASQQQPYTPEANNRAGSETLRFTLGDEVQSSRVTRHQTADDVPMNPGSVMATLQQDSRGKSVELIPGNPASRTLLDTAIRNGLVREIAQGVYADAQQPQQGQQQGQQQQQQGQDEADSSGPAPFEWVDRNDMAVWNAELAPVPQSSYDSAVASTVALAAGGDGSVEGIASQLASASGMEPELAMQYVSKGISLYRENLSRDLSENLGMSTAEVEQFYADVTGKPGLKRALSQLMHEGKTSEFRALATAYKRETAGQANTNGSAAAFKAAGMDTRVDYSTGELMVKKGNGAWFKARDL